MHVELKSNGFGEEAKAPPARISHLTRVSPGASWVQDTILRNNSNPDLRVYAVWFNMLYGDCWAPG